MVGLIKLSINGDWSPLEKEAIPSKFHSYCGWKKLKGFRELHSFSVGGLTVGIWGRESGQPKHISKWELPPPLDTPILYGDLLAVGKRGDTYVDLDWQEIYEKLFGGFEDLGSIDSVSEDELENVPDDEKTKEGYLKDGWLVSDESELEPEDYVQN